jgi:uncharacterized protein (TIGR00369 family)
MEKLTLPPAFSLREFSELFCNIPFNRTIGAELTAIEADHLVVHFNMKKDLVGNFFHGILHGGVISAALDATGGAAVLASALQKHPNKDIAELTAILSKTSTVDLHVHFIRPGKGERFIAKAWVTHSGNKLSFARMELYNQDFALLATGSATYLLG